MEVSSRLLPADVLRVGSIGLRTRRLRATFSALGIAIGIASMVAVLRISQSSKADLLAQLDELGTNLLTITPGESLLGEAASLPGTAPKMVGRLDPVEQVATERMTDKTVRRTNYIPAAQTNGISVGAADTNLLATLNGTVKTRVFLNDANIPYPAIVLRSVAAERLAIGSLEAGPMVYVNGRWSASSESSTRSRSTANPANPEEVAVSRPPTCSRPAPPPRPPTPPSSSASAPSPSSSAGSGSPTSWSSLCSSGAPKSGCAGRSARPSDTSQFSFSASRCCSPRSAASPGP
jgi:hypothetical protein